MLTGPSNVIANFSQPVELLSAQFDTQYRDVLDRPTSSATDPGLNSGYGLKIVPYNGDYYAFISNHNQDVGPSPCDAMDPLEPTKYISNLVTVVKINPSQFAPTSQFIGNDQIVAEVLVGCGPEGITASTNGSKVFVANAYSDPSRASTSPPSSPG